MYALLRVPTIHIYTNVKLSSTLNCLVSFLFASTHLSLSSTLTKMMCVYNCAHIYKPSHIIHT